MLYTYNNHNRSFFGLPELVGFSNNLKENFPTADVASIFKEAKKKSSNNSTLDFAKQIYQLALNPDDIRIRSIKKTLKIKILGFPTMSWIFAPFFSKISLLDKQN